MLDFIFILILLAAGSACLNILYSKYMYFKKHGEWKEDVTYGKYLLPLIFTCIAWFSAILVLIKHFKENG